MINLVLDAVGVLPGVIYSAHSRLHGPLHLLADHHAGSRWPISNNFPVPQLLHKTGDKEAFSINFVGSHIAHIWISGI